MLDFIYERIANDKNISKSFREFFGGAKNDNDDKDKKHDNK